MSDKLLIYVVNSIFNHDPEIHINTTPHALTHRSNSSFHLGVANQSHLAPLYNTLYRVFQIHTT